MDATAIKTATKDNLRERVGSLLISMYLARNLGSREPLSMLCTRFKLTNNMGHILDRAGIINTRKGLLWEWAIGMPTDDTIEKAIAGHLAFRNKMKLKRLFRQAFRKSEPAPIKQLTSGAEFSEPQLPTRKNRLHDIDDLLAVTNEVSDLMHKISGQINMLYDQLFKIGQQINLPSPAQQEK